jgi:hypothetical protein
MTARSFTQDREGNPSQEGKKNGYGRGYRESGTPPGLLLIPHDGQIPAASGAGAGTAHTVTSS